MNQSTVACPLNLTPETLAAYRDGALAAPELARIRAHLADCPACTVTLARFDSLARILASQRIPIPDARLWRGVHARLSLAPTPAPHVPARAVWGGLGTLATLVVLVALFAQIFRQPASRSISYHLTPQPTGSAAPTMLPPTPVDPTTLMRPDQAWGSHYITDHLTLSAASDNFFTPDDIFPDGSALVGTIFRNGQQSVVLMNSRTQAIHVVYTAPASVVTPFLVQTDGRFVVWDGGFSGAGTISHQEPKIFGYADLQTGRVTILSVTLSPNQTSSGLLLLDQGMMLWETYTATTSVTKITDLATNSTRLLPAFRTNENIVDVSLPYLLTETTTGTSAPYTMKWRFWDLTTGQIAPVSNNGFDTASNGIPNDLSALSGKKLFWVQPASDSSGLLTSLQLGVINRVDQPWVPVSLSPALRFTNVDSALYVNDRLVIWEGRGGYFGPVSMVLIWDRLQRKLLCLTVGQNQMAPQILARGHALALVYGGNSGFNRTIDVIDTNTLPTTPP